MIRNLKKFAAFMAGFKSSKKALIVLIVLDVFMAVGSNIVDWPMLVYVDWYLIPFAPICSLYPLTLAVWFTLYYFKKKIPAWFTTFIFIGITGYGVMAQVYYPVFIYFEGLHWNLVGNMVWVAVYAVQSLIIVSELKPLSTFQYLPIIAYFFFKDYSDRYLGTFTDVTRFNFSEFAKDSLLMLILVLHTAAISLALYMAYRNEKKARLIAEPDKIYVDG